MPHGDYATVIADRTNPEAAAGVIRELLRWSRSGVIIELAQLPGRAELRRQILELAGNRFVIAHYQDLVCPCFPITEETVDAIRQKKSARRHSAALRRMGDLAVHHLLTSADIVPWLEAFFEQHVERWSSTPFPSLFVDALDREFYGRLARSPEADGRIIFTVILLNGEPAAFHFGFGFGETCTIRYKPAFDPKLARSSPGEFLLSELVTMAHRRGFTIFDFGRGDEPFKRRYASEYPANENLVLYPGIGTRVSEFLGHQARRVQRRITRTCVA